ncbi:cell division protein ZapE [Gammaproteobacteria bacterium]|nr:cell division protein ZapE [Gammaproteobacteria bacterium]
MVGMSGDKDSLVDIYHRDIASNNFKYDSVQHDTIILLDKLAVTLIKHNKKSLKFLPKKNSKPVKGLYLYGGVGRGKTYMTDLFYNHLEQHVPVLRTHFHRFMQSIHQDMHSLRKQKAPIVKIVNQLAKQYRIICLDELFVTDIGDAMILGYFFKLLFAKGVSLLVTSNIHPKNLYKNGLQRELFIPAIDQLMLHLKIVTVDNNIDYRLGGEQNCQTWHLNENDKMLSLLHDIAQHNIHLDVQIKVLSRYITSKYVAKDVIWFEFKHICAGPRSQNDYIEIAKLYKHVFISDMPVLDDYNDAHLLRFIYLVDELYDRQINLYVGASAHIDSIYIGTKQKFAFERTKSRLYAMQSIVR